MHISEIIYIFYFPFLHPLFLYIFSVCLPIFRKALEGLKWTLILGEGTYVLRHVTPDTIIQLLCDLDAIQVLSGCSWCSWLCFYLVPVLTMLTSFAPSLLKHQQHYYNLHSTTSPILADEAHKCFGHISNM